MFLCFYMLYLSITGSRHVKQLSLTIPIYLVSLDFPTNVPMSVCKLQFHSHITDYKYRQLAIYMEKLCLAFLPVCYHLLEVYSCNEFMIRVYICTKQFQCQCHNARIFFCFNLLKRIIYSRGSNLYMSC